MSRMSRGSTASYRTMCRAEREDAFHQGVRSRDVISGFVNTANYRGFWIGFEAAHIFPLEKESHWIQYDYGRWITDMDGTVGVSKINSLQSGLVPRVL
jgi:hypothetical protein